MLKIVRSKNERMTGQDNRCGSGIIRLDPFNTGGLTKIVQLPQHIRLSKGTKTMGTLKNLTWKPKVCKLFLNNSRASGLKRTPSFNNSSWTLGKTMIVVHKTIRTIGETIIAFHKTIRTAGETIIEFHKTIRTIDETIIEFHKTARTIGETIIAFHKTIRTAGETIIEFHKTIRTIGRTIIDVHKTIRTTGKTIIAVHKIIRTIGRTIIEVHERIRAFHELSRDVTKISEYISFIFAPVDAVIHFDFKGLTFIAVGSRVQSIRIRL